MAEKSANYNLAACMALAAAAVFLTGQVASANMANPLQAGDQVGEPSAALRSVEVEHEELRLDLTGLGRAPELGSTRRLVAVSADYTLRNAGPTTTLPLVFVAPGLQVPGTDVSLDGSAISSTPGLAGDLPPSWRPPTSTPGIKTQGPVPYQARGGSVLRFFLPLAPGEHRVSVHYMALPTTYDGYDEPARLWQVGYVLAPARQWASFGGLAVTVEVPRGWLAASEPALTRSGDTLKGTFKSVPADSLAVTTQFPAPPAAPDLTIPAVLGGLVLVVLAGWLAGRWLGQHSRSSAWALPLSILSGGGLATVVAQAATAALETGVPGDQLSRTFNYGRGLPTVGTAALALFGGLILCQLSAALGHHRAGLASADHPGKGQQT